MGGLRYLSRRSVRERPGMVSLEIQPSGLSREGSHIEVINRILVMTYPFTVVNRHIDNGEVEHWEKEVLVGIYLSYV